MKIAAVCAMNMNRSMAAHKALLENGFDVYSYGTRQRISLPGSSIETPNIYDFGISYNEIYEQLVNEDEEIYGREGILGMLARNAQIKDKAEYFFDSNHDFDLIITCEEPSFRMIYDYYIANGKGNKKTHIINFDIVDTTTEAVIAAENIRIFVNNMLELSPSDHHQGFKLAIANLYTDSLTPILFSTMRSKY